MWASAQRASILKKEDSSEATKVSSDLRHVYKSVAFGGRGKQDLSSSVSSLALVTTCNNTSLEKRLSETPQPKSLLPASTLNPTLALPSRGSSRPTSHESRNRHLSRDEIYTHWTIVEQTNQNLSKYRARRVAPLIDVSPTFRSATPSGSQINPFILPRGVKVSDRTGDKESDESLPKQENSDISTLERQKSWLSSSLSLEPSNAFSAKEDTEEEPSQNTKPIKDFENSDFVKSLRSKMQSYDETTRKQRQAEPSFTAYHSHDTSSHAIANWLLTKSIAYAVGPAQGAIMFRSKKKFIRQSSPNKSTTSPTKVNFLKNSGARERSKEAKRIHEQQLRRRVIVLRWQRAVGKVIIQQRMERVKKASLAAELLVELKREKQDREREAELKIFAQRRAVETVAFFEGFTKNGKRNLCVDGLTETLFSNMFTRFKDLDVSKAGRVHLSDVVKICADGGLTFREKLFFRVDKSMMGSFTFQDLMRVLFPDCTGRQMRTLQRLFDRSARNRPPPSKTLHALDVLHPEHIQEITEVFKRADKHGRGIVYRKDIEGSFQDTFYVDKVGLQEIFPTQNSILTLRDFADVMKWSYPPFSTQMV